MDVNLISQFIGSYGFPIVAFFAMLYMYNKEEIRHKEEVDNLSETIKNNTEVIKDLLAYLRGKEYE